MAINRSVIIGAVGITTAGVLAAVVKKKPITPVVIGGYLIAVLGGFLDLFGGGASQLAGSIAIMAFIGVLLYESAVLMPLLKVPGTAAEEPGKEPPGAPEPGGEPQR